MSDYELTLVLDPKLSEKELEEFTETFKKQTAPEARVEKSETWGRKQLAYPLKKSQSALYLHFQLNALNPNVVSNLSNKLKINKNVLRYLLVKSSKSKAQSSN